MRNAAWVAYCFLLFGCGVDSLGTAATVGKLQAEQAQQAQKNVEEVKTRLEAAMTEAAKTRESAEEAGNK